MGENSGPPKAPDSRYRWVVQNIVKHDLEQQIRFGHQTTVGGEKVFVNYVPDSDKWWWNTEDKEKLKYTAHLSHSPPRLERYNQTRRNDFQKGLPKALIRLQKWCDAGGAEADPRFYDQTDVTEESEEEEEQENELPKDMVQSNESAKQTQEEDDDCETIRSSSSDRTEEATVISDSDSTVAKNMLEDEEDVDEAVNQTMDEIIDRVVKAHDKMQAIRLKWTSLKKG